MRCPSPTLSPQQSREVNTFLHKLKMRKQAEKDEKDSPYTHIHTPAGQRTKEEENYLSGRIYGGSAEARSRKPVRAITKSKAGVGFIIRDLSYGGRDRH